MAQKRPVAPLAASAALVGLTLLSAICWAQDKPDYSTPKAGAKTYAEAVLASDAARVKAACTGDEKQMRIVEAMVASITAIKQLEGAIVARFGSEQVKAAGKPPLAWDDAVDAVKRLSEGEVKVTGDKAVITPQSREGDLGRETPLPLRKVGGEWKVDLAVMFRERPDDTLDGMQALASTVKGLTGEVNAGRYKTPAEANQATDKALEKMREELSAKQARKQPPAKQEEKKGK
jgi:hypothetical protein